jgi:UDP-2,3-diacylglucosamine hydrolase
MPSSPIIGLIAGGGELPLLFAREAKRRGFLVQTAAVRGSAQASIEKLSDNVIWISIGQLGALIGFFKKRGVKRAVMHGKVQHSQLFRNFRLDWKALQVWSRLKDRSGEALLKAVAKELQDSGTTLLDGRTFMEKTLIPKGYLTGVRVKGAVQETIIYGLKQARRLAQAGIGQTIAVKGNAVASVEAMEGSDEAIRRAGRWAGPGVIVIKAASPRQDWRFDIPTLGPRTLQSLIQAKAKGIVVEGGRAFLLNRPKTVALAGKYGIFILAV